MVNVKKLEKPSFYSESEWEEIGLQTQKATDKYVVLWLQRQAVPYLMKEKIDIVDLEHILDFFNSESPEKPPRLGKISYVEAVRQANRWTELEAKRVKRKMDFKENPSDVEVVFKYEKDTWVKLLVEAAYVREGANMQHCVGKGGYFNSIIYSLRDEENEPHCTIEVAGGRVKQIKGKNNRLVIHKYHKSLFAFLSFLGIKIDTHDLEQYGFIICKQGNFDADSLPDEVEVLTQRKVFLSLNARIPKKMIAAAIEIETRKDLDLSGWTVAQLTVKSQNNNVKLPSGVKVLHAENSKFNENFIDADRINLTDSSLIAKKIKTNGIELANSFIDVDSISTMRLKFKEKDQSKIRSKVVDIYELSTDDSCLTHIVCDSINVGQHFTMTYQKGIEAELSRISLMNTAKLTLNNLKGEYFKIPWKQFLQLDLNGPVKNIDFNGMESLHTLKNQHNGETWFLLSMKNVDTKNQYNILPIVLKQEHKLIKQEHYYEVRVENKVI
jgi:hypothetical protein